MNSRYPRADQMAQAISNSYSFNTIYFCPTMGCNQEQLECGGTAVACMIYAVQTIEKFPSIRVSGWNIRNGSGQVIISEGETI